jgi:deoxyribodipyrimidine photolyase-related protein
MGAFQTALAAHTVSPEGRRFIFVPYDQLGDHTGPLSREDPRELGIVLVECPDKAARRPYHQQKLAFLLTNLRHFAIEQAARGVVVRHVVAPSYAEALTRLSSELGPMRLMRPAERELRAELSPLIESKKLELLPHEGWLTNRTDLSVEPPFRMDVFYRNVRKRLGILMDRGTRSRVKSAT